MREPYLPPIQMIDRARRRYRLTGFAKAAIANVGLWILVGLGLGLVGLALNAFELWLATL